MTEAKTAHERKAGTHGRAVVVPRRTTVCGGTESRASRHGRVAASPASAVLRFSTYLVQFLLSTRARLFGGVLGRKLGFRIALINPFRERLD